MGVIIRKLTGLGAFNAPPLPIEIELILQLFTIDGETAPLATDIESEIVVKILYIFSVDAAITLITAYNLKIHFM